MSVVVYIRAGVVVRPSAVVVVDESVIDGLAEAEQHRRYLLRALRREARSAAEQRARHQLSIDAGLWTRNRSPPEGTRPQPS